MKLTHTLDSRRCYPRQRCAVAGEDLALPARARTLSCIIPDSDTLFTLGVGTREAKSGIAVLDLH